MTLSAFLRDYLYFPLGGNRKGKSRRYANLMATMLLGGLWHGAGWTFIVWGGLHGLYLMINHGWIELKARLGWGEGGRFARLSAGALTFLAVVVAWVFFRADSFATAYSMLSSMLGTRGIMPEKWAASREALKIIIPSLILVWLFPNVRQIFIKYRPVWEDMMVEKPAIPLLQGRLSWRPSVSHAWAMGILFLCCILNLTKVSEFLYFQF